MALGDDMVRGSVIGDSDRLSDIVNGDAAMPDRRGTDDCFSTIPLRTRPMSAEDASESRDLVDCRPTSRSDGLFSSSMSRSCASASVAGGGGGGGAR